MMFRVRLSESVGPFGCEAWLVLASLFVKIQFVCEASQFLLHQDDLFVLFFCIKFDLILVFVFFLLLLHEHVELESCPLELFFEDLDIVLGGKDGTSMRDLPLRKSSIVYLRVSISFS
jgi:hypothetical protein